MTKKEIKNPYVFLIVALVGLLMMAAGVFYYLQSSELAGNGLAAEGTVTKIFSTRSSKRASYYANIEFKTVDGQSVSFDYSIRNSNSLSVGEKVPVLYLRDNPAVATKNSFNGLWSQPLMVFIIGFQFGAIGIGLFFHTRNRARLKAALAFNGRKIMAKVLEIYSMSGAGDQCAIWAQYEENGQKYLYTSENIALPPEALKDLKTIEITVDPNNLKKYLFDTEKILADHAGFTPKIEPESGSAEKPGEKAPNNGLPCLLGCAVIFLLPVIFIAIAGLISLIQQFT